jgi:hypothetical protein
MIPIVAGLMMGAALGGGIAALQKKDVLQGALMGGIGGALGGAFMPAAGAAGTTAAGAVEATAGTLGAEFGVQGALGSAYNPAIAGATNPLAGDVAGILSQSGAPTTAFPVADAASIQPQGLPSLTTVTPTPKPFGIGNFLDNKYALAGGALGGMMAPGEKPKEPDQGNIYDYDFDQQINPRSGEAGQPFYLQSYNLKGVQPANDYDPTKYAANGGIIALADGGVSNNLTSELSNAPQNQRALPQDFRVSEFAPVVTNTYAPDVRPMAPEVAAYNQQMMQRANQQYNINPRPLALQVPGMDRAANAFDPGYVKPDAPAALAGPKDYIDDYYQQMLGRNADPTGRKLIEDAITAKGGFNPAQDIAETIRQSAEFKQSGKNPNPTGIEIGKVYSSGAATNTGIGGLGYDPKTGRYTGTFEAPGNKKSDLEKMREELDALKSEQSRFNDTGGGEANGGLMRSYAMGGDIGGRYQSPDDMSMGDRVGAHAAVNMGPQFPMQGQYQGYASGGHLGDYSDGGRLLKGPGDGVSDDIPAQIGRRQPARLADGEFVVPARIVSELGNGSTDAGAKRLYAMMDRVQNNRRKSVGKGKVAVDSRAYKHLPA